MDTLCHITHFDSLDILHIQTLSLPPARFFHELASWVSLWIVWWTPGPPPLVGTPQMAHRFNGPATIAVENYREQHGIQRDGEYRIIACLYTAVQSAVRVPVSKVFDVGDSVQTTSIVHSLRRTRGAISLSALWDRSSSFGSRFLQWSYSRRSTSMRPVLLLCRSRLDNYLLSSCN